MTLPEMISILHSSINEPYTLLSMKLEDNNGKNMQ
jgi:hypothetical protein